MEAADKTVLAAIAEQGHVGQMLITKALNLDFEDDPLTKSLKYLEGHGLIQCGGSSLSSYLPVTVCITAKGVDYLRADGGLTAELGVVTVRIHLDSVKAYLAEKAVQSDELTAQEKNDFLKKIHRLNQTGAEHFVRKLVDYACENSPKLIPWLQTILPT